MKSWFEVLGGIFKTLIIAGAAIVVIIIVAIGILFGAVFFRYLRGLDNLVL